MLTENHQEILNKISPDAGGYVFIYAVLVFISATYSEGILMPGALCSWRRKPGALSHAGSLCSRNLHWVEWALKHPINAMLSDFRGFYKGCLNDFRSNLLYIYIYIYIGRIYEYMGNNIEESI